MKTKTTPAKPQLGTLTLDNLDGVQVELLDTRQVFNRDEVLVRAWPHGTVRVWKAKSKIKECAP